MKSLPKDLTSYDLLKSLALILMLIDHVGYFFFPEEMWFRSIGRLCVPVWFFLIGYAQTADVPVRWYIGGVVVALCFVMTGQHLFPLNILFSLALMRMLRPRIIVASFSSPEALRGMFCILLFLTLLTAHIFEYGTYGMLFVLMGFSVRYRSEVLGFVAVRYLKLFFAATLFAFFVMQGLGMEHLSYEQASFMIVGFSLLGGALWKFKSVTFPRAKDFISGSFVMLFQFMGRRTLEIYVVHIVVFQIVAVSLFPDRYNLFSLDFLPSFFIDFLKAQNILS